MKKICLADLAEKLGGHLQGDGGIMVSGVAPLNTAGPSEVSFLANPKYAGQLQATAAAAVIVSHGTEADDLNLIHVKDAYLGFAMAMEHFHSEPYVASGVSEGSWIHSEASIGEDCSIYPLAVVSQGAAVGSSVTLMSGVYVGENVIIGDNTVIHPNVVLEKEVRIGKNVIIHAGTVVGSDGFGFARQDDGHKKIIHAGTVIIEDDVEIGAGCTIDRAVMGETVVGKGSKLDNLIQIGHNVKIGHNCILVAQAGIAGSAELQDNVTVAGQSGVAGHLTVGRGAVVMGKTAVLKDVPPGEHVAGFPAINAGEWRRSMAAFARLDDIRKKVAQLEKKLSTTDKEKREEDTC